MQIILLIYTLTNKLAIVQREEVVGISLCSFVVEASALFTALVEIESGEIGVSHSWSHRFVAWISI